MNIVLLITITFTLALVHGQIQPCKVKKDNNAYNRFAKKHVIQQPSVPGSKTEWEGYLQNHHLCGRQPVQSFMEKGNEKSVKRICGNGGRYLRGNLCISSNTMDVYNVVSTKKNNKCTVTKIMARRQHVIVGCDKVANICLPVHYERYRNEKPGNRPCK